MFFFNRVCLFVCLFTCIGNFLSAQKTYNSFAALQLHGGILHTYRHNEHLLKGYVNAAEIQYYIQPADTVWAKYYNNPFVGISATHYSFGNAAELGYVETVSPFINFFLLRGKKSSLHLRAGSGIAYATKPFNRVSNYRNHLLGSSLNLILDVRLEARLQLWKQAYLVCGATITHFSVGEREQPNSGLTFSTFSLGFHQQIGKSVTLPTPSYWKKNMYGWSLALLAWGGAKEQRHYIKDKLKQAAFAIEYTHRITSVQTLGLALDVFYDQGITDSLPNYTQRTTDWRAGIGLVHLFHIWRVRIVAQPSLYVYNKQANIYNIIGLRFLISKRLFAHVHYKSFGVKGDFVGVGLGYKFLER